MSCDLEKSGRRGKLWHTEVGSCVENLCLKFVLLEYPEAVRACAMHCHLRNLGICLFNFFFFFFFCILRCRPYLGHQESVVLVSRFFVFSCVLKFYEMQKLETQFFFSSTSKNNNYVFSIYTRYQGLLLHICSDLISN